jgi:hypothetical protein
MDKIKDTHTAMTLCDFEQNADHEYAGMPHRIYTQSSTDGCYLCACLAEIDRLKRQAEPVPALTRYNETIAETGDADMGGPLERLRFFCSLAMSGQDWLHCEPFFDALEQAEPVASPGAIPMAEVAARSASMPERADALERARKRLKQAPDDAIGNPSY